jgi:hypothetical protein
VQSEIVFEDVLHVAALLDDRVDFALDGLHLLPVQLNCEDVNEVFVELVF